MTIQVDRDGEEHTSGICSYDCTEFTRRFKPSWELFSITSFAPPQKMIKSFFVRRVVSTVIEEIWVAIFTPGLTKPHTLYFSSRFFSHSLTDPEHDYHKLSLFCVLNLFEPVFADSTGMFSTHFSCG